MASKPPTWDNREDGRIDRQAQRLEDMTSWQPSSGADAARRRAAILERVRRFFDERDVLAVDTPALSRYAVSDAHIESFSIHSGIAPEIYLNTSPEFSMKRLIAAGYPDIYSICRVFRDGEVGQRHQPEFTMIEWYRLGIDLGSIIAETLQFIGQALADPALLSDVDQVDYAEAFRQHANIDVFSESIDDFADHVDADTDLRRAIGDNRDDWLDLILSTTVTSKFATDKLTVLRHYPASQAALARICPIDRRVADRFEVFYGSTELANGYVELTDAREQLQRIGSDQKRRQQSDQPVRPCDRLLIASLKAGLPECAGVAVGLERLQMVHDKTDDIGDVVTFVFEKHHD
jgi:lysyl-tRNA synthetase class 2